jgi:hypothetical protein
MPPPPAPPVDSSLSQDGKESGSHYFIVQ